MMLSGLHFANEHPIIFTVGTLIVWYFVFQRTRI